MSNSNPFGKNKQTFKFEICLKTKGFETLIYKKRNTFHRYCVFNIWNGVFNNSVFVSPALGEGVGKFDKANSQENH